ncbi:hypothetical protein L6164_008637 [Bauhinia variegata]|uniref:Uncharacterized protein n=1 Tax=Bauhinia variegata TaxID=167791 RepID=A0ACB9PGH9_BAUVA|nr:hypothetical protein L6164_008637 [Bauhinia variegata]
MALVTEFSDHGNLALCLAFNILFLPRSDRDQNQILTIRTSVISVIRQPSVICNGAPRVRILQVCLLKGDTSPRIDVLDGKDKRRICCMTWVMRLTNYIDSASSDPDTGILTRDPGHSFPCPFASSASTAARDLPPSL